VPVAYHVTDKHPGGLRVAALKWERVPARAPTGKPLVLHLFDRLRPELTRGVPYLAPVIEHLKQLGDYSDAEVDRGRGLGDVHALHRDADDDGISRSSAKRIRRSPTTRSSSATAP
jgi:hypothetical protein